MRDGDTIVALSSGSLPSGVAVIRISGPATRLVVVALAGALPAPRKLTLRPITIDADVLDHGLVAYFPRPNSFTGEDCAEFQVHGAPAIVRALLRGICTFEGVRLAEAGEFTRRAFEQGKLDLTEVEGLGDLIIAETEGQRVQALARMTGGLSEQLQVWRLQMLDLRAEIEARLDFSDEGDVSDDLPADWFASLGDLEQALEQALGDVKRGRIIREGFRVALAGRPNAGKSSLLNALAKSDLAIVSDEAGTTRDVREVPLDLDGQLVIFVDMAGLRESDSLAETEGVRRAEAEIQSADLVLWLQAPDDTGDVYNAEIQSPLWRVATKADLGLGRLMAPDHIVSVTDSTGLSDLIGAIRDAAGNTTSTGDTVLVSRERDRMALSEALLRLRAVRVELAAPEIAAEALRQASDALARLIGTLDPEQVLDRLFIHFCIGK